VTIIRKSKLCPFIGKFMALFGIFCQKRLAIRRIARLETRQFWRWDVRRQDCQISLQSLVASRQSNAKSGGGGGK
jgi:hypothetical protein